MKKKIRAAIIILLIIAAAVWIWFFGYYNQKSQENLPATEPFVVRTYDVTDSEDAFENDEPVIFVKHYEMSDGTWKTDNCTYKYRLVITGRMHSAVKDSSFVYLSNIEEITFDQAWKASGLSSNLDDYFKKEDARFVGWE